MKTLHIIGCASGIAANDPGCAKGPYAIQKLLHATPKQLFHYKRVWLDTISELLHQQTQLAAVQGNSKRLANYTHVLTQQQKLFAVLGGDHACAIGTWSGVATAIREQGLLGLIWIDAHLDAHTPETTHSGNIHGMPVASLLGFGDSVLTKIIDKQAKILPQHLCIIGARSYEPEEHAFLQQLGVRIFYMPEIQARGLADVIKESLQIVRTGTAAYGISIDLDVIDPKDAPGVGIHEDNGLAACELIKALAQLQNDPLLRGIEIAEYSPQHDQQEKTVHLVLQLLAAIIGQ